MLASIGIVKGQPFEPTDKQKELLQKAVETAPRMILALRQLGRPTGATAIMTTASGSSAWAGATAEWLQDSYLDVNQRATFFQSPIPRRPRW